MQKGKLMKVFLRVLFLIIILSLNVHPQDKVVFKIRYLPDTKYIETMALNSESEVHFQGSEEFMQNLKSRGVQNPAKVNKQSSFETILKTGKLTDETHFPLTLEIVKSDLGDSKSIVPDSTIIFGHGSLNNMPQLDSISSRGMDEKLKITLLQTMQSIFSQVTMPEKEMKIGDEYSHEAPLSIPIAGLNIKMTIKTNYKLLSILKGIADFDITQDYTFNTESDKDTIKAAGKGKGKLLYYAEKGFCPEYQIDTDLDMNMNTNGINLYIKSKSNIVQKTEVSKD